jgi:hypothetical protein
LEGKQELPGKTGWGESARALAPIGRHNCSLQKPDSWAAFLSPENCHLELVDIGQIALTIEFRFKFVLLSCVCELINAYPWNWRPRGCPGDGFGFDRISRISSFYRMVRHSLLCRGRTL